MRRRLFLATAVAPLAAGCNPFGDTEGPRCLQYVGFPEVNDGWTIGTYKIPTTRTVVYIEKLPGQTYERKVLPNGDVAYNGSFLYKIPEFADRDGTVTFRRPDCR